MNDGLLGKNRVPEDIMQIHKVHIISLWDEARKRLPYNASVPYNPIVTPYVADVGTFPQQPPLLPSHGVQPGAYIKTPEQHAPAKQGVCLCGGEMVL